ncbi:hypothetical protein ACFOOJ_15075, partial [Sphingobium xenophagum]
HAAQGHLQQTSIILSEKGVPLRRRSGVPFERRLTELICELPAALERVLGNQVHDVKPRWGKGTAHRVARLLADHIDELERKDALLGDIYAASLGGRHD